MKKILLFATISIFVFVAFDFGSAQNQTFKNVGQCNKEKRQELNNLKKANKISPADFKIRQKNILRECKKILSTKFINKISDQSVLLVQSSTSGTISSANQIAIISPAGGEIWQQGTTQNIEWIVSSSSSTIKYIDISIMQVFPECYNLEGRVCPAVIPAIYEISKSVPVINSSYSWIIPSIEGKYKIIISDSSDLNNNRSLVFLDKSNEFSIISRITGTTSEKYIKVISPSSGEIWKRGSTQTIKWEASPEIKEVFISLVDSNGVSIPISSRVANTGSYKWILDYSSQGFYSTNTFKDGKYLIKIIEAYPSGVVYFDKIEDFSDGPITITGAIEPNEDAITFLKEAIRLLQKVLELLKLATR